MTYVSRMRLSFASISAGSQVYRPNRLEQVSVNLDPDLRQGEDCAILEFWNFVIFDIFVFFVFFSYLCMFFFQNSSYVKHYYVGSPR